MANSAILYCIALYRILIIYVTNAHKTVKKQGITKLPMPNNVIMSIVVNTENSIKQTNTAERLVVSNWLLPAIPIEDLQDQFGFRPTGSTRVDVIGGFKILWAKVHHLSS